MTIYAIKGNREYTILEEEIAHYQSRGFEIKKVGEEVPVTPVEEVKEAPKPKQTRKPRKEVVAEVTE